MTMVAIRERLYDYIRIADDKKLKAIYMMLEDEINSEIEWWKDKQVVAGLDTRFAAWEQGTEEGFTMEQIDETLQELRKKQRSK